MDSLIQIEILEVKSPSQFTARVVLPWEQDAFEKASHQWQDQIQILADRAVINDEIHMNKMCAVKDPQDQRWHRVRVDQVLYTARGERARCYFVDSGRRLDIQLHKLLNLPKQYHHEQVPFQVRSLKLWGLQPVSLQIEVSDSGIQVPHRPCKKWDTSAENFFHQLIEECQEARVKVMQQDENGKLHVSLYLHVNNQLVNVNEILIRENYACAIAAASGAGTDSDSNATSQHFAEVSGERAQHKKIPSPHSDGSINGSSEMLPRHCQSPPLPVPSSSAHASELNRGLDTSFKDGMMRDGKVLSPEELKPLMAKIKRYSAKNKHHSDTEAMYSKAQGVPRLASQPGAGSRPDSRASCRLHAGGDNALMQSTLASDRSVGGAAFKPLLVPGRKLPSDPRVDVADSAESSQISKPSSSESESSSCMEQSRGVFPKCRHAELSSVLLSEICGDAAPASVQRPLPTLDGAVGLNPPVSPTALSQGQGHTQVQKQLLSASASQSNSPLTADVNPVVKSPPGGAGRGRGLRKLYSEDVIAKVGQPSVPSDAHVQPQNVTAAQPPNVVESKQADMVSNKTTEASSNPGNTPQGTKSLMLADFDAGMDSELLPPRNLMPKDRYTIIQEFHSKKIRAKSATPSDSGMSDTDTPALSAGAGASRNHRGNASAALGVVNFKKKVNFSDTPSVIPPGLQGTSPEERRSAGRGTVVPNSLRSEALNTSSDEESLTYLIRNKLRGKAIGQSLLEKLGGRPKDPDEDMQQKVPLVWRPDRPIPAPFLGTMVRGIQPPPPLYDVDDIPFNDIVKGYMLREGFKTPRSIQANTWPAVLRGRNVIGITPPHSGKTTAYLPALVTELLKTSQYLKLPKGCGPKALILVPSCKKADSIHHYVQCMVQDKMTFKVLSIYGSEDHHVMPLLRGCDLLIATPHCLLRMLDRRYTFLDRLCHLVLDGAEILVEQFTAQVRTVMKVYGESLREFQGLPVTRQIMVLASQWTAGVDSFQKAFQPDPVLVFASRLEAAVQGKVQQVVHMGFDKLHLSMLRDVLETLMASPEHRHIVIAIADPKHLSNIVQLLKSQSVYAQVVQPNWSGDMIDEEVNKWRNQVGVSAVLVVTDENVAELRVTSAHTVIHYDIPNSQTKFGNRLALMLEHFYDSFDDAESKDRVEPVSHLLVTDKMVEYVQSLHNFLVRSGATIPPAMTKVLEGMREGRNTDESKALCLQVKQFGQCRNEQKCSDRHLLLPCDIVKDTSEESWPPASGTVKVRILQVISTNHYYVMLMEHQVPGQPKRDLQSIHTSLTMDLAMCMSNPQNQEPYCLEQGQRHLVVVKDDGFFRRAQILSTLHSTLKSGSRKVEVNYVDEGWTAIVRPDQLLKLPPKFQDIPPLAVEVFACRVRPVDGDTEWTRSSTTFVKDQIRGKDLYGTIVLRMKNSLWLDPLVQQTRLNNLKISVVSMIVRSELLKRGMADDNSDHIKDLYKLCQGKIAIPQKLYEKYLNLPPRQKIETETLRGGVDFHEVCISVVETPHHFYVQKANSQKELEAMNKELNEHMEKVLKARADAAAADAQNAGSQLHSPSTTSQPAAVAAVDQAEEAAAVAASENSASKTEVVATHTGKEAPQMSVLVEASASKYHEAERKKEEMEWEQGNVCVAKFADNGSWNRGQLVEKAERGWRVFFVDYGEQRDVAKSNILRLPDKFCALPAQAIECSLVHVMPMGGEEWSEDSSDVMWDLAHYITGEQKRLWAKALETQEAQFAGATKHVVELYDTCSSIQDVHFSRELVWTKVATTEDEKVTSLFPKVTLNSRKLYPNLDAKISDQCAALYWTETEEKAKRLSTLISEEILADIALNGGTKSDFPSLAKVVKLIGYLRSYAAHSSLLSAIVKCVETSPEVCAAVISEDFMQRLVFCMEQARHPVIQLQAATAAADVARIDGFATCLDQKEIITVMGDMLKSDDSTPEMLKHVSSFLSCMLVQGLHCPSLVKSVGVGPAVLDLLAEINDPDTQECLLALLATMANWEMLHGSLVREKAVGQILGVMREAPSQKCVFHCARICQLLCRASRRNKRILLEGELVLIVRDLLEAGLQSPARELCEELNTLLAVSAPQQEVLAGVHYTTDADTANAPSLKAPSVKWSQNSFRVLLTVAVQGASEKDFVITQNKVCCRCRTRGTEYGFDYTLFGDLVPEKCRVMVHPTEVILSLAKQEKGMWSRLLKEKHKFSNLVVDYDNIVGSSESEVEEDENITMLARHKVARFPKREVPEKYDFSYSEDSDSSSDPCVDLASNSDDERFENPTRMVDSYLVLEELARRKAAQEEKLRQTSEAEEK